MKFGKNQFILLGLAAHLLAALFSIGAHQCDEIFQVYEFTGYKLGLNKASELPWEFHEQMRSGIQPFVFFVVTKALHSISVINPFVISTVMRLLQSLFSFVVLLQFLKLMEKEMRSEKAINWLYGFSLLFWCIPYFHARFNSENFSATLFLLGLVWILKSIQQPRFLYFLLAGLVFGIAFESRFQSSFMIAGLILWLLFIQKINFKFILIMGVGLLAAFGFGLLADFWLYDGWTLSWWNYLDLNLFKDKASQFGREPVYYFIGEALLQLIPPFSLIFVWSIIGFWIKFKKHVLTWVTLPFILLHFFVAHKEFRFLFPVLNFLPFMLLYYFQSLELSSSKLLALIRSKGFIKFAVIVNALILTYYTFKPADNVTPMFRTIYHLTDHQPVNIFYEGSNPYSNEAALHYFRNPAVKTIFLPEDSLHKINHANSFLFVYEFNGPEILVKNNNVFVKHYTSFPQWFKYLDFNGWVGRSDPFEIYKKP